MCVGVGCLHNIQTSSYLGASILCRIPGGQSYFPLQMLNEPDFGLVNRPLLPGTLKPKMWGTGHSRVLTR